MAPSKAEVLLDKGSGVSNQEALIKKIVGTELVKPKKYFIPAGKSLVEEIDEASLPVAIYNWLRHTRHFSHVLISFCGDLEQRKTSKRKVVEFDASQKLPEWEIRGKQWLADKIASLMGTDFLLAVEVEKSGLFVIVDSKKDFSPESEDWLPYIELLPVKAPTF